jgi:hypothetical protein
VLVGTQARLKPYLDDGFVHEDRQKRAGGLSAHFFGGTTDSNTLDVIRKSKIQVE